MQAKVIVKKILLMYNNLYVRVGAKNKRSGHRISHLPDFVKNFAQPIKRIRTLKEGIWAEKA